MSEIDLKKLSHRHQAIAEWLLANPDKNLATCASELGYTQAWLSTIVNSQMFKAFYAKLLGDYHDDRIVPLRDKLNGVAHRAADKLSEKIDGVESAEVLMDILNKSHQRLEPSLGKQRSNNLTVIFPPVDPRVVAAARARIIDQTARPVNEEVPALSHQPEAEPQEAAEGEGG